MHRLVGLGYFWGALRHLFSGKVWYYVVNCLGVAASILAIQYVFKGGRGDQAAGEENRNVNSETVEPHREDITDTLQNTQEDAQEDAQGDAQEDAQGDVQGEVQEDAQGDVQGDVQEDAQGDAQGDVQEDAQEDEQGDAQGDAQGDVQEDAQEDEQEDFTFHDRYFEHDYECDYDSTWDTAPEDSEENALGGQNERTKVFKAHSYKFERFKAAARDLQNYRHDYPIRPYRCWNYQDSDKVEYPNLDFYLGKLPSSPDDVYIWDFHTMWRGQYDILESVHTYIQWLFPLQEQGVNPEAPTLTKEEIQEFCQNDTARKNLLESYKLMLDFYGIELSDEDTGEVKRAPNFKGRFRNLNTHTHNNLRITRMLKCMGTLGFKHYQAPLVHFFLEETLVNGELPRVKDSVLNYYLFTVCDKQERRSLLNFAYLNFDKREEFVWCPKKIQIKWEKQNSTFKK
uniref:Opioid growth factor receptor (OGFr) conserved domain-containing protein n=1 Tax=Knipowitschia caucasica TaxID=637954 RepID=A0AAV2M5T9_KNICA